MEPVAADRMSLEQLEREIAELAAHINAAPCRWLLLVGELDRREGWLEWGCKSCALALAAPGLRRGDRQRLVAQNRGAAGPRAGHGRPALGRRSARRSQGSRLPGVT